jgi:hypothetical protein
MNKTEMLCHGNLSNCSASGDGTPLHSDSVLLAFGFLLAILLLAVIVFILVTLLPVLFTNSLPKTLRFLLGNQLLGGLLVAATACIIGTTGLVLVFSGRGNGSIFLCTFLTYIYGVGAIVRMWSMTAYSVVILLIIVYSRAKIKLWAIVVAIIVIWVFAGVINLYTFIPQVYAVYYVGGTACFPDYEAIPSAPRYGLSAMWIILGGVVPVCISVVIPIICFCYLKRESLTERSEYKKAMVKFALFLVIGNFINLIGQAITAITALYVKGSEFYIAYSLVVISLVPTPILILIFLKAVRQKLMMVLCCCCTQQEISQLKKSITSNTAVSSKDNMTRLHSLS